MLVSSALLSIACQNAPVINRFYADNSVMAAGEENQLHWSVSGADSVAITDNYGSNVVISDNYCIVSPIMTTTYNLIASNKVGTDNKTVVIAVDLLKTGDRYLGLGKNDLALNAYESAVAVNPSLDSAWMGKIQSQINLNQYADAIKTCGIAVGIFPTSSSIYCLYGIAYNKSKQYDMAIIILSKALELNPENALAYVQRGNVYSDSTVRRAWEGSSDPDYNIAGYAYGNSDQLAKAIADFTRGIALDPTNVDAFIGRGCSYAALGKSQYLKAIADYTKAIEINPQCIKAYFDRGIVFELDGQFDAAISDFTKAIELNPNDPILYYSRGTAYARKEYWNDAVSDYLIVTSISKDSILTYCATDLSSFITKYPYRVKSSNIKAGTLLYNLFPSELPFSYWPHT